MLDSRLGITLKKRGKKGFFITCFKHYVSLLLC